MDSVAKHKAVIANPFSTATMQPKIPDGSATHSMGAKRNVIKELDFQDSKIYDIIISPRYDSPVIWRSEDWTSDIDALHYDITSFNDNHPFCKAFESVGGDGIQQILNAEISKIRLVSQGAKLTVVNSADDNDGWFEAFRFSPSRDTTTYFTEDSGPAGPYTHKARPNTNMFGNRPFGGTYPNKFDFNMAAKNGYVTGKLRDLHRYTWTNRPTCREVEFKPLPRFQKVGGTNFIPIEELDVAASVQFQDWDYDVIWIRVHGRAMPATSTDSCCQPTKLLLHLVQNVECIFGEQNMLHSYMTKSPMATYGNSKTKPKYQNKKRY